jgi:cytochrome P450
VGPRSNESASLEPTAGSQPGPPEKSQGSPSGLPMSDSFAAEVTLKDLSGPGAPQVLAALGEIEPISWIPAIGGWLVARRDPAVAAMRDAETFTVDDQRFPTGQVVGPSMLSLDDDEHRRNRSSFVAPYRRGAFGPLSAWIEAEAIRLIDGFSGRGFSELRTDLAAPLATATIHRSLGFSQTRPAEILAWYRAIAGAVSDLSAGLPAAPDAAEAIAGLRDAVARTVADQPSSMLARIDNGSLSGDELAQNTAIVLFGAIETAEAMTTNALWHLLTTPAACAMVCRDPTLIAAAVEESLRLEPAAAAVDRYATRDVVVEGVAIAQGDLVRVTLTAANRDHGVFADPDVFDIGRENAHLHLAFATGPHVCVGPALARAETAAAIAAVLDKLPEIVIDHEASTPPTGLIFRKPQSLTD